MNYDFTRSRQSHRSSWVRIEPTPFSASVIADLQEITQLVFCIVLARLKPGRDEALGAMCAPIPIVDGPLRGKSWPSHMR